LALNNTRRHGALQTVCISLARQLAPSTAEKTITVTAGVNHYDEKDDVNAPNDSESTREVKTSSQAIPATGGYPRQFSSIVRPNDFLPLGYPFTRDDSLKRVISRAFPKLHNRYYDQVCFEAISSQGDAGCVSSSPTVRTCNEETSLHSPIAARMSAAPLLVASDKRRFFYYDDTLGQHPFLEEAIRLSSPAGTAGSGNNRKALSVQTQTHDRPRLLFIVHGESRNICTISTSGSSINVTGRS
jgi:hypothetical protein